MPAASSRKGSTCRYTWDGNTCGHRGRHYCEPRADRVVGFFEHLLVHTKGDWARTKFKLADWQEHDIVRPLFGMVRWDEKRRRYVRQYRVAWIELGRKNGKSELGAGFALYLLVGDDEESSEVYGAAKDTKQAGKVFEVAHRMSKLSPVLSKRLDFKAHSRRLFDERTHSYYEIITADSKGELGHNPHGVVLDEVLTQAGPALWETLRTSMGARSQPLMVALTTATDDPAGFAAMQHAEMERIAEDPSRAPHVFAYLRNTPRDADPWVEENWYHANPALGDFLDIEALRDEALEAQNDPTRENAFRQYRLNQHVQQVTRWMPLHLWDLNGRGSIEDLERECLGEPAFGGLDLASTTDLASWVLWVPDHGVLWRFWTPEAQIPFLDRHTGGKASVWAKQGLLKTTEGDWIDYDEIHATIERDLRHHRIIRVGYDQKEATATAQFMQKLGLTIEPVYQGFGLSPALKEMMRLVKSEQLSHGGHPVARWNADSAEVKRDDLDRIKVVKPDRGASGKRIDGIAALANAIDVWLRFVEEPAKDRIPVAL